MSDGTKTEDPEPVAVKLAMSEPPPLTMTRDEVARELQVTTKTVDNLWRRGELPRPSRIGRGIRWRRADISRWLQENRA